MTQINMMNADNPKYSEITEIFKASYKESNILEYSFLEKAYCESEIEFKYKVFQTRKILFNHNYQRHQRSIFGGGVVTKNLC